MPFSYKHCVRGFLVVKIVSLDVDDLGGVAGAERLEQYEARWD